MPCALSIPPSDLDEFGLLSSRDREEVLAWLECLSRFEDHANKSQALTELAVRFHGVIPVTKSSLYRKREMYKAQGWKGLLNLARTGGGTARALPEEFIQFWQGLCLGNQRKTAPAYRALFFNHLNAGKMIPGYGGDWRTIYTSERRGWRLPEHAPFQPDRLTPHGWGYRNLCRYAPDKFSLTAARIGMGAASTYLPRIPTTRAGLRPGQFYVIDDVVHDVLVNFAGNAKAYTPLELGALDLFTGNYVSWGLKPVRELDNGEKEHIRKHYMRALLVHLLCVVGFDADGVTILGEHGTATMRDEEVKRINTWAGGLLSFEAGGLHGAPIAKGMFDGRPRGNSRFKAALESHHNLKHNELAHLPGQKGKDRDHSPEEMYGRDKENNALVKACIALAETRPDLVRELSLPYMSFERYREFVALAYDRINHRLDHHLEGFEPAGLLIQEYRLDKSMPWLPMTQLLGLPGPARNAVEMVIHSDPEKLVNCRAMSPAEAWADKAQNLRKLSLAAAPDILGPEFGIRCKVNDHSEIIVTDADYRAKQHHFAAVLQRLDGFSEHLSRGREIIVHLLSPIDSSFALVSTPDGAFLGAAPALARASRTDVETLHKNLGLRSKVLAHEVSKLRHHANEKIREREEASARNAEAILGRDPAADFHAREEAKTDAQNATRNRTVDAEFDDLLVTAESLISNPGDEDENDLSAIY